MRYLIPSLFIAVLALSFGFRKKTVSKTLDNNIIVSTTSVEVKPVEELMPVEKENVIVEEANVTIEERSHDASQFVDYARSLIGTPYLYGSVDPSKGLDCSGFVNCVSDHFGIKVPRSSVDFTEFGTTIEANDAQAGDLILFTGTNAGSRTVGHIGIVTENINGDLQFIHSSSGKAKGVTISGLDDYYKTRFVKVIRIFPATGDKTAA